MQSHDRSTRGAVLITGASSGIGKSTALYLDSLGFQVFAGIRREADGEAIKRESEGNIQPVLIDVADAKSIEMAGEIVGRTAYAGLHGLVNNAGIVVAGPLEFLPLDDFRRQLEVNVTGQIAVTQAFLPLIRKSRGRIVFMGSISGRVSNPFISAYAASKFCLEAIADAMRVELMPWGISVSIVEPGNISTPIWEKSIKEADSRVKNLPAAALDLYGPALAAVRKAAERSAKFAIPPSKVAEAVAHALMAERPKARYVVGWNARLQLLLRTLLPARILDRIIGRYLRLPRPGRQTGKT